MLNILKDLVEVRVALELMEGFAIAYGIGPCSINNALLEFDKYLDRKKEFPDMDDPVSVAIIYGLGVYIDTTLDPMERLSSVSSTWGGRMSAHMLQV